jgi:hypothetical protein
MANGKSERTEGYPSLAAREHWGKYAAGMATEALYILVLTAVGFLLAVIGMAVWQ